MSAVKIIQAYAKKSLTKNQGSGITALPSQFMAESKAGEIAAILQQAGMPLQQLDNFIRSEADLLKYLNIIKNAKPVSTTEKASGTILPFKQKRSFAEEIDAMKKSGDIVDVDDIKISEKITDREMFKNSNLNKPTVEGQMDKINAAMNRIKEIQKEQADMYRPKTDAEIKAKFERQNKEAAERLRKKQKEAIDDMKEIEDPEEFAKGGRIGFRAGKFVFDKVVAKFLKNQKKLQEAVDDIFPTGDYKYDAEMAADAFVENNPQIFKNLLREDLPDEVSSEIYGAVLRPITNNMAKMRELRKATRPEKTLQSMKENKTIDMSDPEIADEFTRFMKETDPEGYKKLEQTVELSNFDPKGRKKNAKGGRIGLFLGGNLKGGYSESRTDSGGKQTTVSFEGGDRNNNDLPPPPPPSETVGIETVIENDFNPNKFKNYIAANNNLNLQNYLDFQNRFNLLGTDKTYDEYIEMIDDDKTLNPFQEEDMYEKSQEILQQHKNNMLDFEKPYNEKPGVFINPEQRRYRMAAKTGGRAGFYTGGITDVEPSLDDIGHGADAMNARTRLMSPGSQATTSTGLNYLLAEDNDNMRIPFKGGGLTPEDYLKVKDMLDHYHDYKKGGGTMSKKNFGISFFRENNAEGGRIGFSGGGGGRRAFLKMLGLTGAGIAGLKSGIIGLGEGGAKKAVTETIKQSAGSGTPPPYFFKLVEKIKTMGDDVTQKAATQEREVVTKYKDFELTENIATGEKTIQRKKPSDFEYYDEQLYEDVYMNYKPGKGQADEAAPKVADEYVEDTSYIRTSGPQKGDVYDTVDGVPKDVVQEGTVFEDNMTEFGMTKKADGGRIGYVGGGLSKLGITGSSRKFLEKVFGKQKFQDMIKNDPELHRGMLEVVEMFRSKDKAGLVEYMQNFLPQMSKKELEAFVVGSGDTAGIEGQLIRLGSGRDYKNKIEMIEEANNIRKLKDFDVEGVSKNAEGGRIGLFLGGPLLKNQLTSGKGLLREMLNYMSKGSSSGKTGSEMLQMVNPKQFEKLLNDLSMYNKISPEAGITAPELIRNMIKKTKDDRAGMVEELLSSARNIKKVDDDMIGYKNKIIEEMINKGIDREMAETFADMMSKKIMKEVGPKRATPEITEKGLLELENIQKNLINKDRKLQAQGGLTTMLGE